METLPTSMQPVYCKHCHGAVTLAFVPWAEQVPPKAGMEISVTNQAWTCPHCRSANMAGIRGRLSSIWAGHRPN